MNKAIEDCLLLNKSIKNNNLVKLTWGNASVLSDDGKSIAIKPSGVDFNELTYSQICIIELYTGKQIEGKRPSVDTPIHLEIYKAFPEIKSIIHSHSKFATAWAQALKPVPILGTTHADYFLSDVPVAKELEIKELDQYEKNLGQSVVDYFQKRKINPLNIPAILLPRHGVMVFSDSPRRTLECAIVLEEISEMAYYTTQINREVLDERTELSEELYIKHFERKNGINKYYGQ
jgi:L-ribulose-5-phosphate 4-epimerase|tara:strand:- start:6290 stop:6988 length:699 start_codon:yes stop_codon:yes gene_type:complete